MTTSPSLRSGAWRPQRGRSASWCTAAILALGAVSAACGADDDGDAPGRAAGSARSGSNSPAASPNGSPSPNDQVLVGNLEDAVTAGFPALAPTGTPAGWTFIYASFDANFHDGTWNLEYSDEAHVPVTFGQTGQSEEVMVDGYISDGVTAGVADLTSYGLGRWDVYENGTIVALAKQLPSTSVIVLAKDRATVETLTRLLIEAKDSDLVTTA